MSNTYINPYARDLVLELTKAVHLTSLLQQDGKNMTVEAHDALVEAWTKSVNNVGVHITRMTQK